MKDKDQKEKKGALYMLKGGNRRSGNDPQKQRRGIFLLPNLLTTAALCSGLYAIHCAVEGHTTPAVVAIFAAIILDGLDGRVARLINAESDFGQHYDSLSDLISFGVAPALLTYQTFLKEWGTFGLSFFFMYVLATALRLARYNAHIATAKTDKEFFEGMPSPAAAGIIAGYNWLPVGSVGTMLSPPLSAALLLLITAGLMVSVLRYPSFKEIELHGRVPFFALVLIVPIITIIATNAHYLLFTLCSVYAVIGVIYTLFNVWKQKKQGKDSGKQAAAGSDSSE